MDRKKRFVKKTKGYGDKNKEKEVTNLIALYKPNNEDVALMDST